VTSGTTGWSSVASRQSIHFSRSTPQPDTWDIPAASARRTPHPPRRRGSPAGGGSGVTAFRTLQEQSVEIITLRSIFLGALSGTKWVKMLFIWEIMWYIFNIPNQKNRRSKGGCLMKIKTISSFDAYVYYTEPYKGRYFFRGQADASWNIKPSLFRCGAATLEMERQIIHNGLEEDKKATPLSILFHAQHYGTPTRICDVTVSHLSALFFASEGDADGVVFVMDKSKTITTAGYEMGLFTTILTENIYKASDLPQDGPMTSPKEIITQNYVVDARDFNFSNERSFRQGGTGIVFGFEIDNDNISPIGRNTVDELIIEKIIIPQSVKNEISDKLRRLGYSREILYIDPEENSEFEGITLTETESKVDVRFDPERFNKVIAKYRLNTLYYDRDALSLQIDKLYRRLFARYGANARIWTFFYYDENDLTNSNWICRGEWPKNDGYAINWNKSFRGFRLHYMNEQISRDEALARFTDLVNRIEPIYDRVYSYVSSADFDVSSFFALIKSIRTDSKDIFLAAGDISRSDADFEKFSEAAYQHIADIDWLIGDMAIFADRADIKEQYIRWSLSNTYIPSCEKSKRTYLEAKKIAANIK
jgi:hypothetical protein